MNVQVSGQNSDFFVRIYQLNYIDIFYTQLTIVQMYMFLHFYLFFFLCTVVEIRLYSEIIEISVIMLECKNRNIFFKDYK